MNSSLSYGAISTLLLDKQTVVIYWYILSATLELCGHFSIVKNILLVGHDAAYHATVDLYLISRVRFPYARHSKKKKGLQFEIPLFPERAYMLKSSVIVKTSKLCLVKYPDNKKQNN